MCFLHCIRVTVCCAAKAAILDGAGLSKLWQQELSKEAAEVRQQLGRPPGLAVVTVGDRPDSKLYVQRKQEACAKVCKSSTQTQVRFARTLACYLAERSFVLTDLLGRLA